MITLRLTSSSLAGTLRKLVAVGTVRLASMLRAIAAPAPRIGLPGSSTGAAAARRGERLERAGRRSAGRRCGGRWPRCGRRSCRTCVLARRRGALRRPPGPPATLLQPRRRSAPGSGSRRRTPATTRSPTPGRRRTARTSPRRATSSPRTPTPDHLVLPRAPGYRPGAECSTRPPVRHRASA